ncbi:MAG: hypothetical protein JNN15_02660 [Blastocatellia bacterium]|nr:hypothetical protein [Blastocatellia bacterium]
MDSVAVDLAPLLNAAWKRRYLILFILVVANLATFLFTFQQAPTYSTKALIKIARVWGEPVEDPYILTELISGKEFLKDLSQKLDKKESPKNLAKIVSVQRLEGGKAKSRYVYLIKLSATSSESQKTKEIVEKAATLAVEKLNQKFEKVFQSYSDREKELRSRIEEVSSKVDSEHLIMKKLELESLRLELSNVELNNRSELKTYRASLIEPVDEPEEIAGKSRWSQLVVANLAAFALAILVALVLEFGLPIVKVRG